MLKSSPILQEDIVQNNCYPTKERLDPLANDGKGACVPLIQEVEEKPVETVKYDDDGNVIVEELDLSQATQALEDKYLTSKKSVAGTIIDDKEEYEFEKEQGTIPSIGLNNYL